ncbi:MAG: hypothetical protein AABZ30_06525, partial [Myxococcota bacterium]
MLRFRLTPARFALALLLASCGGETPPPPRVGSQRAAMITPPVDSQFVAFDCATGASFDPDTDMGPKDHRNVVGDPTFPALYRAMDATYLYLRMRVDTDPTLALDSLRSHAWGWLFDTNNDFTSYEYAAFLDGGAADSMEWCENIPPPAITVPNSSEEACDLPPLATYAPAASYWHSFLAPDGSNISGNPDYFLTVAVRLSDLTAAGISVSDPLYLWAGTSTSKGSLNTDLSCNGNPTGTATLSGTTIPQTLDPLGIVTPNTTLTPSGFACGATIATATPSFTFSCTNACSSYQCSIDGAAWASCTTPYTTPSQADGAHTLQVRARKTSPPDSVNATDQTPASCTFTVGVDTTAPDTTITGQPTNPTNDNTPTFTFTSTEAG